MPNTKEKCLDCIHCDTISQRGGMYGDGPLEPCCRKVPALTNIVTGKHEMYVPCYIERSNTIWERRERLLQEYPICGPDGKNFEKGKGIYRRKTNDYHIMASIQKLIMKIMEPIL